MRRCPTAFRKMKTMARSLQSLLPLLLCLFPLVSGWFHRCPPPENVPESCQCLKSKAAEVHVDCRALSDTHRLSEALFAFRDYVLDALVLSHGGVFHMVPGLFGKVHVHRLTFRNVSFDTFAPLSSLKGTENFLEELTFDRCTIAEWIWSGGTQFRFLKNLTVKNTRLPKALQPEYFAKFPNKIERLTIQECGVERLANLALKRFAALKYLKLDDNALRRLTRNSLAPNLAKLIHLSLRGNPLEDLPDDMFTHMPRLESLMLGQTSLKALRWKTFQPIWEQLEAVFFNDLQFRCDCDSAWLIDVDPAKMPAPPTCSQFRKSILRVVRQELCAA